jgi:predicted negative regulator of RcsB-dependent stress response
MRLEMKMSCLKLLRKTHQNFSNSSRVNDKQLKTFLVVFFLFWAGSSFAQEEEESDPQEASYIHGDFQTDAQYYFYEPKVPRAEKFPQKVGNNTYLNLLYDRGNLSGGVRFEVYQPPLQGYDQGLKGAGIPFRFINYKWKELSVTLGNFYEQFGSGLIYRSYWDWGLGFDNSIDGARIRYNLLEGIQVKAFVGKQRINFEQGPALIRGADMEFSFNELFSSIETSATKITAGAGVISKYQEDEDPQLRLPENVAAFSGRAKIARNAFSFETEYAYKANDPSAINKKIYRPGQALLLTGGFSANGFGISLGAKRIDNFDFRGDRESPAAFNRLAINYLPPLTPQHTYRLATLYPYATQPLGEMGAQADIFYNAKEGSLIGGKYGTSFSFNYCNIKGLKTTKVVGQDSAKGYNSNFLSLGKNTYYQNLSLEISKKISPTVKTIVSYIFIEADNQVLQQALNLSAKTIYAHIGIIDVAWKFKPKHTLRTELQHLQTDQDNGSWAMALLEYQMGSHYFFAIYDEYNYGNKIENQKIHYLGGSVGYTKGTVRVSISGGRQRAGVFCVGGVCRFVPASSGVSASIAASF